MLVNTSQKYEVLHYIHFHTVFAGFLWGSLRINLGTFLGSLQVCFRVHVKSVGNTERKSADSLQRVVSMTLVRNKFNHLNIVEGQSTVMVTKNEVPNNHPNNHPNTGGHQK